MVSDFGAAGGADIVLAAIAGVGGWGLAAGFPAGTGTGCTCGNSSPTAVSRSATNSPIAAGLDASAGAGPVRAPAAAFVGTGAGGTTAGPVFVGAPARNSSPSDVSRSDTNSVRMPGFAGAQATGSGSGSGWGTDSGCGAGFTTATGAGSSTSTGSGATTGS